MCKKAIDVQNNHWLYKIQEIIEFLNTESFTVTNEEPILEVRSIEDTEFNKSSLGWCSFKNIDLYNTDNSYDTLFYIYKNVTRYFIIRNYNQHIILSLYNSH